MFQFDHGRPIRSRLGLPFEPGRVTDRVRRIVDEAGIRFIQAMLGHASLDTTQIYAQVGIRVLKTVHTATHPGRMPKVGQQGVG